MVQEWSVGGFKFLYLVFLFFLGAISSASKDGHSFMGVSHVVHHGASG